MDARLVKDSMLFKGMSEAEVAEALDRLAAVERSFEKGSVILNAGSTTDRLGLVLQGSVTIENNDVWGNKTILSHVGRGQFFAETYGFLADEPLLVDVVANEECRIAFLRIGYLQAMAAERSSWTAKLIANLLRISAHKNLALSGRSFHTSPKTIRERVMSYLSSVSIQRGATEFDIPFNRQQMADYLNLERTALSKELRKMADDGLIAFRKNHFELKEL